VRDRQCADICRVFGGDFDDRVASGFHLYWGSWGIDWYMS